MKWECIYCDKEFADKENADKHESRCIKNPNNKVFPYTISPKRAWAYFWVTTLLVFGIACWFGSQSPKENSLYNNHIFLYLFLGNIGIGIISFIAIAFSRYKPKNKTIPLFVKYALPICLIYLLFHTGVIFSISESIEKQNSANTINYQKETPKTELQNTKYNGKVLTGTILNKSNKPIFNTKILLRISKDKTTWNVDETHEFVVAYKIDANQSINFSENFKSAKKNPWWTSEILESYFYNGENVPTPSPTAIMVDCLISKECGGGSKLLTKSVCDNSTCCEITGKGWIFYQNKQDCIKDQNIANNTVRTTIPTVNQINTTNYPLCTVYYPALKYSQSYYNVSPTQCQQWQNDANRTASQNLYSTPTPYIAPTKYITPTMTQEQAQSIIDQHNSQVSLCRAKVDDQYNSLERNCSIQYGDSSATEACIYAYEKGRKQDYNNCGQTY